MKCPTQILTLLSLFGTSLLGYLNASEGTFGANITPVAPSSYSDAMLKKLSIIIENYKLAPNFALKPQDITDLNAYASDCLGISYDFLNKFDRASLAQIINLNKEQFSAALVEKFNADQKLIARMNTKDIQTLKSVVGDIQEGKSLTDIQITEIKSLEIIISENPYAFIEELSILTPYVALNLEYFTPSDLDIFRQASREATGLSETEFKALYEIANRGSTVLNPKDIAVLSSLELRSSIGALNGIDPATIINLRTVINTNSDSFPTELVSTFNAAYNTNQILQYYVAHSPTNMTGQEKQTLKEKEQS